MRSFKRTRQKQCANERASQETLFYEKYILFILISKIYNQPAGYTSGDRHNCPGRRPD